MKNHEHQFGKITFAIATIFLLVPSATGLAQTPETIDISVLYKGQADTLQLTRHSLRSIDFFVRPWETDHFNDAVNVQPPKTYTGTLANSPGVSVIARLHDDSSLAEALVILPNSYADWMIVQIDGDMTFAGPPTQLGPPIVDSRFNDSACGLCDGCCDARKANALTTINNFAIPRLSNESTMKANGLSCGLTQAELAFDVDNPFYLRYDGDIQAIVDRIEWLTMQVDTFYQRDAMLTFKLTGIVNRTTQEDDLYGPETSLLGDLAPPGTLPLPTVTRITHRSISPT